MHSDRKESTGIGDKTSIPLSFILYLPDGGKSFACYRRVNFSFIPYAGQHTEEEENYDVLFCVISTFTIQKITALF